MKNTDVALDFNVSHNPLYVMQYKTVKMVMMRKCVVSYLTCIIYSDSLKHILLINNV